MPTQTNVEPMAVSLDSDVLFQYPQFSLYNSPYVAHDDGCAIDLYPDTELAPSPVAGEVRETRTVTAPSKPYSPPHDHLILVDTGEYVARLLHVDPAVESGDTLEVGEPLGTLVRAGFFAPWVSNHVHLEFRPPERNPYRASGSVPIDLGVAVQPLSWDGTGTVREAGETWATLDTPSHPAPGETFVGLASDGGVLDGGFPHYDNGGVLGPGQRAIVAGACVGTVSADTASSRTVSWRDCTVRANGERVTGIALFCARDSFGIKLVGEEISLAVGTEVTVTVR